MRTIVSAISLVIAAGFGAIRIHKAARGSGSSVEKIMAVYDELSLIIDKLQTLAAATEPTWDDTLASSLSEAIDVIAENVIAQLEG